MVVCIILEVKEKEKNRGWTHLGLNLTVLVDLVIPLNEHLVLGYLEPILGNEPPLLRLTQISLHLQLEILGSL